MKTREAKKVAKAIENKFKTKVQFSEWNGCYVLEIEKELDETELYFFVSDYIEQEYYLNPYNEMMVESGTLVTIYK